VNPARKTNGVRPQRLVCFGDSITAGRSVPDQSRWTALLAIAMDSCSPAHVEIFSRGTPGSTSAEGLARFDKEIEPLLPATVLVQFGLNDSSLLPNRAIPRVGAEEFRATITEIARLVSLGGGKTILLTNHTVSPSRTAENGVVVADLIAPYQESIRRLAAEGGHGLIDVEWAFRAVPEADRGLAADGIHLDRAGHQLYSKAVLAGLQALGFPD